MLRHLFTTASVVSLLLCAAVVCVRATVWLEHRSIFWKFNGAVRADGTRPVYEAYCERDFGHFGAGSVRVLPLPTTLVSASWPKSRHCFVWRHLGFDIMWGENVSYIDYSGGGDLALRPYAKILYDAQTYFVEVPCWAMVAGLMLMPLLRLRSYLLARRAQRLIGCCPRCEYNLTGNSSGVCPECGTPTTQEHPAISN